MKLSQEQLAEIEQWVLTTIRWCVNHPESCQLEIHPHDGSTLIDVTPHPDDFGAMVGQGGSLARAVRTIFGVFQWRYNHNIVFHVKETEEAAQARREAAERKRQQDGRSSTSGGDESNR